MLSRFHPLRRLRAALAAPETRTRPAAEITLSARRTAAQQQRGEPWR